MASFLSKLARLQPESDLAAVIRNLTQIFNSRKGYGSVVPEFGIGDYDDLLSGNAMVLALIDEFTAAIRDYEYRLTDPTIEYVGRDARSWIRFRLAAQLDGSLCHFHIDMDTTFRKVAVALAPSFNDGAHFPGIDVAGLDGLDDLPG